MSRTSGLLALGANSHNLACADSDGSGNDAALFALSAGLGVLLCDVDAFNDDCAVLGRSRQDLALLALILTGQNYDGIASLNMKCIHFSATSLQYFGSQGEDSHVILLAQLTSDGSKDTSAAGVLITGVDKNSGILVETDVGAICTANGLDGTNDDCLNDVTLLDGTAGSCLADGANYYVTNA